MPPTAPLPSSVSARLAHVAERHGLRRVAAVIGVSPQTVARAAKGHGVYCGNRSLIESRLPDAEALTPPQSGNGE